MRQTATVGWALLGLGWPLVFVLPQAAGQAPEVTFCQQQRSVRISIGNRPVASYVYDDAKIPRPYLCNVRSPGGIPVTRHHPPREGVDPTDHASLHPGIWMAFGDLGGADNWRNRGRVLHGGFVEKPEGGLGRGTFAVRNLYLDQNDPAKLLCREVCRMTVLVRPSGYLLLWDSAFWPVAEEVWFGDQEEMGLGVRVASPIAVRRGGRILNSEGQLDEEQVWGEPADWCDYSGRAGHRWVGITLMADPANFRPSWFHARDYGLLVANPFGRRAFGKGEPSRVVLRRDKPLRLRYAVLLHSARQAGRPDLEEAYADFLRVVAEHPRRGNR